MLSTSDDVLVPLTWVEELLTSQEAVDRIAAVCDGRPRGVSFKEALALALPYLGTVLADRAERSHRP